MAKNSAAAPKSKPKSASPAQALPRKAASNGHAGHELFMWISTSMEFWIRQAGCLVRCGMAAILWPTLRPAAGAR